MPGWLVGVWLLAIAPATEGSGTSPQAESPEASFEPPAESPEASPEPEPLASHRDGPDPNRLEIGVLPALAYDTNTGFGFGVVGTLAKFAEEANPYAWRLEALFYMTVLEDPGGGVRFPFHDYYVLLDVPGLWEDRLRLTARLAFNRRTNTGYYGMGNDSDLDAAAVEENPHRYEYDHISPRGEVNGRLKLHHTASSKLDLILGVGFAYNWIETYEGSKLEEDLALPRDTATRELLAGRAQHAVGTAMTGIAWDSRDHEYAPQRGMFHELSVRGGLGGGRFVHGGLNLTGRFFLPVWEPYLIVASRLMLDLLFGQPPIHELARHGGLRPHFATGGATSVRGVPGQRFHGKVKTLGNVELRSTFLPFELFGERFNLGALAFLDAGRVWADYRDLPALDGDAVGIKLGTGGGLRLQWGETFILRSDFAYSPTEDSTGFYVDINHIF